MIKEYDAPHNFLVVARNTVFTSIDRITVEKDGKQVPGKSILKVMMLAAAQGSVLKLVATGPDAVEALTVTLPIFSAV